MKPKFQLKDNYCEASLKSDYEINQVVKFKEGIRPLICSDNYKIKDIRFKNNKFEYLLETEDFSRFWEVEDKIQIKESEGFTISGDSINFSFEKLNYEPIVTTVNNELSYLNKDNFNDIYLNNDFELKPDQTIKFTDYWNNISSESSVMPLTISLDSSLKSSFENMDSAEVRGDEKVVD